jgi:hypothetical protein
MGQEIQLQVAAIYAKTTNQDDTLRIWALADCCRVLAEAVDALRDEVETLKSR